MNRRVPCFIKEHNWPNCFAYATTSSLNGDLGHKNPPAIKNIRYALIRSCEDSNRKLYVQINGRDHFQYVLVNAKSMEFAGFTDNEEALVEFIEPTTCDAVEVAPLSNEDFQVIESNVYEIESTFLDQCRLLANGMIVPFFSNAGRPVLLKIVKIHPETEKPVLLTAHTELHVAQALDSPSKETNREENRNKEQPINKLFTDLDKANTSAASEEYFDEISPPRRLRVLPREIHGGASSFLHLNDIYALHSDQSQSYGSTLYVSVKTMRPSCREIFAILHLLSHGNQQDEKIEKIQSLLKKHPGHCLVSSDSPLSENEALLVSSLKKSRLITLKEVEVCVNQESIDRLIEAGDLLSLSLDNDVRKLCDENSILFGNHGMTIKAKAHGSPIPYQLCPPIRELMNCPEMGKHTCFRITKKTKPIITKTSTETPVISDDRVLNYGFDTPSKLKRFRYQEDLVKQLANWIDFSWSTTDEASSNHSLLLGDRGTGKSSILQILAKTLAFSGKVVFCRRIDCSTWKGKAAEKIKKHLLLEMNLGIVRSPSVIFLDGIDLISSSSKDEEHRMIQLERIFTMLRDLLKPRNSVQFVCSSRSLHSIHPILLGDGGQRFFGFTVKIPNLALNDRLEILDSLIESQVPLDGLAKKSEGFVIAELERLAKRVQIAATIRGEKLANEDDLERGLEDSRPISSKESSGGNGGWEVRLDEVGGMRDHKRTLEELLLWPGKYSDLFDRCGVRMGRGILLCGPSGCGKTILAKAFAAHTKFQTIFVKGPELLSKYIGSSEENVRNAFARARASAPCCLVFDELDSLAPKRGADNTGVTDRVVNQLLTEMDGAEGLNGVFVIGCTSRVDLIDTALLRPGRFDHKLICGLPNQQDREDILAIVLRKIKNEGAFDLGRLAEMSDGWTGADLNAWLLNAHFAASRKSLIGSDEASVTYNDVLEVFEESRPKPRKEQAAEFRAGQRVTLA